MNNHTQLVLIVSFTFLILFFYIKFINYLEITGDLKKWNDGKCEECDNEWKMTRIAFDSKVTYKCNCGNMFSTHNNYKLTGGK